MIGKLYYKVRYSVTTSSEGHGEFSKNQQVNVQSYKSETNDLNEVFTDLFDIHRHEGIIGLEILSVDAIAAEMLPSNNNEFPPKYW